MTSKSKNKTVPNNTELSVCHVYQCYTTGMAFLMSGFTNQIILKYCWICLYGIIFDSYSDFLSMSSLAARSASARARRTEREGSGITSPSKYCHTHPSFQPFNSCKACSLIQMLSQPALPFQPEGRFQGCHWRQSRLFSFWETADSM